MSAANGETTDSGRRAVLLLVIAAALSAVLIFWRLRGTPFQWDQFYAALTKVDWRWLAASAALMLLTYVGRALRWEVMLRPLKPDNSFSGLCSATVIGFTAVVLLGRAGEFVRPYLIAVKEHVSFSSQMGAWLLERILDTLVVLLIFGFVLTRIPEMGLHLGSGLAWLVKAGGYIIAGLCLLCAIFLVVFRNFSESGQQRILSALTFLPEQYHKRIESTLRAFSTGLESIRSGARCAELVGYTLLEWVVITGSYFALFRSFRATSRFDLLSTLIFIGFVSLGSIVQIPGIGGGVQVATVLVLTQIFGLSLEVSSGLAILIWVLSILIVVPFGLLFAFHEGINWKKFRHLPEDVLSRS